MAQDNRLCLYTIFGDAAGAPRPLVAGLLNKAAGRAVVYPLYHRANDQSIYDIEKRLAAIAGVVQATAAAGMPIVTSDFKDTLEAYNLPLTTSSYGVYDLQLPRLARFTGTLAEAEDLVRRVLAALAAAPLRPWQKILADAAVVYQFWQNTGVLVGFLPRWPRWSQRTYSGRSKTSGFNLQGTTADDLITGIDGGDDNFFVFFDWVAADARVAALLARDAALEGSFAASDPYEVLRHRFPKIALSRDEAKIVLLRAINSFDTSDPTLVDTFPDLARWLISAQDRIARDGHLESVLGRRFRIDEAKDQNPRAVLNGAMQGSVAHAMQLTIRRAWEKLGGGVLFEVHDALIAYGGEQKVRDIIDTVVPIMTRPFAGVLPTNPFFPVRVSLGKKYKQWRRWAVYREAGRVLL